MGFSVIGKNLLSPYVLKHFNENMCYKFLVEVLLVNRH
jgi:hypothetical protein